MNHPESHEWAVFNTVISGTCGFIAWVSREDMQIAGSLFATTIGIVSGFMAIRYYHFAIKEKKQTIKNNTK